MRRILTVNGDYFIFYAPEGALTDDAVEIFRTAARTGADFLYGDEIRRLKSGRETPIKKSGPSPDTLLSYNYIGSPVALSGSLLERVGPPASGSYAERWSFVMRAFFEAEFVLHVPRVLYIGPEEEIKADAGPVSRQLKRLHREGQVNLACAEGCVTVRYSCPVKTRLSVVIAVQNSARALRKTLDSLELWNTETQSEYIVADGAAPSESCEPYYSALRDSGVRVLRHWYEPNLARLFNLGACEAGGDALLFLRAGDTVKSADALKYMLEFAIQPHIGAVSAWSAQPPQREAYVRNVGRILRAPLLTRDKLTMAGGFDESLSIDGCEAALSLRLREKRLRLVQTPDAVIRPTPLIMQQNEKTVMRCRDLKI